MCIIPLTGTTNYIPPSPVQAAVPRVYRTPYAVCDQLAFR